MENWLKPVKGTEYEAIPKLTLESLRAWANEGLYPGDFVRAVLRNDLQGAFAYADTENRAALGAIVKFVYNRMPMECWGSANKVSDWWTLKLHNQG